MYSTVVFFTVNTVHCIFHSVHGLIAGLDRELGNWDLTTDAEILIFTVFFSVHVLIAGLDHELGYWDLTTDAEILIFTVFFSVQCTWTDSWARP